MGRRIRLLLGLVLVVVGITGAASEGRAEDFNEQLLAAGKLDYQASRMMLANDELRIAAFGLLDRPLLLSDALVRLALTQSSLGLTADLSRTIDRFIDVEQRFQPYSKIQIEPPIRTAFEALLVKSVPAATLTAIPSLSRLVDTVDQKIARMPRGDRLKALEASAAREPGESHWPLSLAREYASSEDWRQVIRWAGRALQIEEGNLEARALLIHADLRRSDCVEALALLGKLSTGELDRRPELYADQTVCYADQKQWKEARASLSRVVEPLRSREDVKRAAESIAQALPLQTVVPQPIQPAPATPKPVSSPQPSGSATFSPPQNPAPSNPATSVTDAASGRPQQSNRVLDQTRAMIQDHRYGDAIKALHQALTLDPRSRPLHIALLETSVLSRDYRAAVVAAEIVSPFVAGEELSMFYAAVAMFESGRKDEARRLMTRAAPRMTHSQYVDYYVAAILGPAK